MGDRICSIQGCGRVYYGQELCSLHYQRAWKRGLAPVPSIPVADRLAAGLTRMPNGCLEWTKGLNTDGYGQISVNSKSTPTHRLAWTLTNGPIPQGMDVLHKCDNPCCCDTENHLFLGTHADNMADRDAKGRCGAGSVHAAKTHCPQGHPYDEANTFINPRLPHAVVKQKGQPLV